MFRDFPMTFTSPCRSYVQEVYAGSSLIVEYGTGGSTCYAAQMGKTVLAVESSLHWLMELTASCAERNYPGRVVPLWADIGGTKEWGYPVDESGVKRWHRYSTIPWLYCEEHGESPDTVLIDGRFRVACFIATCLAIKRPTRVLFDDFVGRPHYHDVLKIVPEVDYVGDRLAVFNVQPGCVTPDWLLNNLGRFHDTR